MKSSPKLLTTLAVVILVAGAGGLYWYDRSAAADRQAEFAMDQQTNEKNLLARHDQLAALAVKEKESIRERQELVEHIRTQQAAVMSAKDAVEDGAGLFTNASDERDSARQMYQDVYDAYTPVLERAEFEARFETTNQTYRSSERSNEDYIKMLDAQQKMYREYVETKTVRDGDKAIADVLEKLAPAYQRAIEADNEAEYNRLLAIFDAEFARYEKLVDQSVELDKEQLAEIRNQLESIAA